ncbi:GHKL domain-containing protein [Lachnospiraceae bacterium MD1]|uniref:GHKL domain-containing protein n=1 Tax=Variimorphobacter saccharofermentans TaxID=2755051 RepID=A0A839K0Z5_9FIRM|nr:sensor histidine kinase [Variimorphobacter saccharofermentans]MBB2182862.1 GHKL domain-containing protein [Variimorphobacter saccharofermentans]
MITNKEMIRFAYFPLLTLGTIFALIATTDYENMVQNISLLFIAVGMAIMNMVIFYLIHDIIDREIQIQNDRLVQERTKNQMRLYYTMKESFEKQKKYMHDYKNQLNCIKGLLMNGKLQESIDYITGLTGNIDMDMDSIHTNNVVADAVINQKYRDAKRNGIIIMITVNDLSRLIITEQDLVSLLSNLLDNAIEACQKLEENKVIQFKCMNDKNQLIIAVNNPVREDIQIIDQRIATTKENKQDHGIGLLNIREIINKYNGTSAIKCENHWFYFSALIPNEIL